MKKMDRFTSIVSALAVTALMLSCGGMEEDIGSITQASKLVCGAPAVFPLVASDSSVVGQVSVHNDQNKLHITYTTTGDWVLLNTKFHVARFLKGIPHNKKNTKFKRFKFRYKKKLRKTKPTTYTKSIKLRKKWTVGTELFVAAFARVAKLDSAGKPIKKLKSWAKGSYFKVAITECYVDLVLPSKAVTMVPKYPGGATHWILNLKKVPDFYDVWDGAWDGWCVEKNTYMKPGYTYTGLVVSSQDTAHLPDRAKNVNWALVNYLLNNKHPKASKSDIQNAIWHLLGYIGYPTDAEAKAMVNDAKANGKGFRPGYGQKVAVIFLSPIGVQLVFLEAKL